MKRPKDNNNHTDAQKALPGKLPESCERPLRHSTDSAGRLWHCHGNREKTRAAFPSGKEV